MSEQQSTRSFQFGSVEISYKLSYQDRKTLGIRVHPDCQVSVIAPIATYDQKLARKLKEKAPWIIKQQQEFLSYHPLTPPRKYINGESHLYLGRQYRLKIENAETSQSQFIKLKNGRLLIQTTKTDKEEIASQLDDWYRQKAEYWFNDLLEKCIGLFPFKYREKLSDCQLVIRRMPTRWGSCTEKGKLILNPELIKAAKGCIEYVIIHELCHVIHHNHTRAFYQLQETVMPDWKKWKDRLERSMV